MVRTTGLHLEVARIQSEINRLFEHLLRLRDGETSSEGWTPGVDVAETDEHLLVEAEVPGVDASTLEAFTQGGNLVLRGERPLIPLRDEPDTEVLLDERGFGRFERVVPLSSSVNPHKAEAWVERGVLRVRLPRVKNRRGEPVPIAISSDR